MAVVEIEKQPSFSKSLSVEYDEFNASDFFSEIMPYVRTPHKLYRLPSDKQVELLIGLTHPVLMRFDFKEKSALDEFVKKLNAYGFHLGSWNWL